jgi:DNA-binding LacI/PurR family transcriptional regulator
VPSAAVHGVILAFGVERRYLAPEIARRGTPCVVVAEPCVMVEKRFVEDIPGVGWVHLDLESGARAAARLLVDLGHRRIGFIGNFEDDVVRESFTQELIDLGYPLAVDLQIMAGSGREAGAAAMRRLLSPDNPPTAVFARTDVMASGALQMARQMGVRVPEELSLIGHDDTPLARRAGLTTVRIDCTELGQVAAQVLTRLRQEGSPGPTLPIVSTRLIERNTVSRPPLSAASVGRPVPLA